jgi:hypothetical protein
MGNGEWGIGNREWVMGNRESIIGIQSTVNCQLKTQNSKLKTPYLIYYLKNLYTFTFAFHGKAAEFPIAKNVLSHFVNAATD